MAEAEGSVLVVEDDANVAELVRLYLSKAGFRVALVGDGREALQSFRRARPDLVILDIMLPSLDGWEVCRAIRGEADTPIIMLTARGTGAEKVLGLELGADDYVVKPFDPAELVARVKAVLRRARKPADNERSLRLPALSIDPASRRVEVDGDEVPMTPKEFDLLLFLARHQGRVFTREQILNEVWGYDFLGDSRTVDVHVKRLRKKLEADGRPWRIATVWGVGYKFEVSPDAGT